MLGMLEAGVKAVGTNQLETAISQGFSDRSAFFNIILPQAALHFLPTYQDEYSGESRPQVRRGPSQMPQAAPKPEDARKPETFRRAQPKVGRNDPCPCGSGKKYKNCCMAKDMEQ